MTKDEDFHRMSVILGPPPKVIWIRLGNCTSESILALLLHEHDRVMAFEADEESAFLALG